MVLRRFLRFHVRQALRFPIPQSPCRRFFLNRKLPYLPSSLFRCAVSFSILPASSMPQRSTTTTSIVSVTLEDAFCASRLLFFILLPGQRFSTSVPYICSFYYFKFKLKPFYMILYIFIQTVIIRFQIFTHRFVPLECVIQRLIVNYRPMFP